MTLEGRVALVTGGGWNVGRAIALTLASEGAAVAICGRNSQRLEETARLIEEGGGHVLWQSTDVTRLADLTSLVDRISEVFGPPDILAAIAGGGGGYEPIDQIDPELWARVVQTNLVGTFHAIRAVLPAMRRRQGGSILTCTGGGAWFPMVDVPCTAYASAKAGICRLTDQLAVELMPTGIRVNCLQPGLTWDPRRLEEVEAQERESGQPHPQRAQNHNPQDSAELALWLISESSAPLTGRSVSTDEDWWRDPTRVQEVCASHHAYTLRRVEL